MTPDRFFSLLLALQSRESTTTADLAARVGVSVRTVLRDLRWLQEAGLPVHIQRGRWGGVTLLPGGALDTSRLTPAERDQLALAGLDDAQRRQLGTAAEGRRARRKVAPAGSAPHEPALPLSAVATTDNRPWFGRETTGVPPAALVGDLRRAVRLRVCYRGSADAAASWRTVDPYGLLAKGGRWYLVADQDRVPRLYALERLVDWAPLRTPRRLRPDATLATVARALIERWETTDAVRVEAVLAAAQLDRARRILGTRLTVHPPAHGPRVRITVRYRELEDVRQLLQFADDLTVLEPPRARDRLRQLAARVAERYG